ncbi:unannotated protein [freshwater metagenome]|uniref:Unannotated protein n=1 Tax=freshwater metagenome TaxID=449393 RepID=A0A6J5ZQD3_9ZZZZ
MLRRIGVHLAGRDLVEVRNYPFIGVSDIDALGLDASDSRRHAMTLANPLSDELPLMRTTLLPSVFGALARNISRGFADSALFEIASVVAPSKDQPSTGVTNPPRPSVSARPSQKDLDAIEKLIPAQPLHCAVVSGQHVWSDAIEIVLTLASELGVQLVVNSAAVAPWHAGRCAQFVLDGTVIGHAGELTPRVIEAFSLPKRTVALEINLDAVLTRANTVPSAPQIWTFPVAKEDIALVVGDAVAAQDVLNVVREAAGDLLEDIKLFDVYQGAQVAQGHKSLAFALRFRAQDRTLSAEEVAAARLAGIAAAEKAFGATLRG